jgi:hypothetical protein
MKPVVYTGNSISHKEATKILDADYRPPVRRDDIKKLIKSYPEIIGIIDGVFFDSAAVAHREIIEALNNGIIVVGGASMGALRASELDSYGMIGVGKIYEMYKNGILESDDEVAVIFDADTNEPLSIPLINIRMTVTSAQEAGILIMDEASSIIDVTRQMFYPDRNYRNIVVESLEKRIIESTTGEKLLEFFKKNAVDVKHEDAVLVLEKIKELRL